MMADLMAKMVVVTYLCPEKMRLNSVDESEDAFWVWKSNADAGGFINTKVYVEITHCVCGKPHTVRIC